MARKPIFAATHPRACSTAFERVSASLPRSRGIGLVMADTSGQVFMTRQEELACFHEPFGDAFYYGPERLSARFENDEQARNGSGFAHATFQTILNRFEEESAEVRRSPLNKDFAKPFRLTRSMRPLYT